MTWLRWLGALLGIVATGLSAWGSLLILAASGDTGVMLLPGPAALFLVATLISYGATIAVGFGVWWAPAVTALVVGLEGWWLQQFGVSTPWLVVTTAEVLVATGMAFSRESAHRA